MTIAEQIQKLSGDALIEVFSIDTTVIGGEDVFDFHAGTNAIQAPILWQGTYYQPFPIIAEGFDISTRGTLPRPKLRVANVTGIISAVLTAFDDLVGAKVTRKRTFAMYLDGQPTADPTQFLPDDVFYIEKKVSENKAVVEFELASAMDLMGVQLPARQIIAGSCPSEYRGVECGYAGPAMFDVNDESTTDPFKDVCSKRVTGCKVRFPKPAPLPFGGFPAARTYKY